MYHTVRALHISAHSREDNLRLFFQRFKMFFCSSIGLSFLCLPNSKVVISKISLILSKVILNPFGLTTTAMENALQRTICAAHIMPYFLTSLYNNRKSFLMPTSYPTVCPSGQLRSSICGKHSRFRKNEAIAIEFAKEFENDPNLAKKAPTTPTCLCNENWTPLLSMFSACRAKFESSVLSLSSQPFFKMMMIPGRRYI